MKIKISILDDNGNETENPITREIPNYDNYSFAKGILFDVHLLLRRNADIINKFWLDDQICNAYNKLEQ